VLQVAQQDLTPNNTLGLSVRARRVVTYTDVSELEALSGLARSYSDVVVLGGGSNVVMAADLEPLVIKVQSRGIRVVETTADGWVVEAQAGESWHEFVAHCVEQGWHGLENLALIPGTVGAAPVQNIGAYGVELDQRLHSVQAWNVRHARLETKSVDECGFAYRHSMFKQAPAGQWLIVGVRFNLSRSFQPVLDYPDLRSRKEWQEGRPATARQVFEAVCDIRRQKLPDPAQYGNAGSFFKNPVVDAGTRDALRQAYPGLVSYAQPDGGYKLAAGWLIEQAGWKGRRLGPVGMHDRQALVLVNYGGATARDVLALAQSVKTDVSARFGVRLEQEPVLVG
jgi:UDP-N-acetylmuramate dehydrogenase